MTTKECDERAYDAPRVGRRLLVGLFWVIPLSFYLLTVSRTPGWVDAPLLAKIVHRLELSTWVNNHNLFTLVGAGWLRLLPRSMEPHYVLNLLCAVLGALTVYVVFRIVLRLTNNAFASALGAMVLMVSHSMWWHSTMLEVYTLGTLLLAAVVLFVVRYEQRESFPDLCFAVFFFGLACSNHPQLGLLGFGFIALFPCPKPRQQLSRLKNLAVLSICFLAGFQVYLWVFVVELIGHLESAPEPGMFGAIILAMLDRATGGDFKQYMFPSGLALRDRLFWWTFYLGFFVYNFPLPWLLLAPAGALAWVRSRASRTSFAFFAVALLAQLAWSANYFVWDMYAFSLPAYVMTGILIGVGVDWVCARDRRLRAVMYLIAPSIVLIPVMYGWTPGWISRSERAARWLSRVPQYEQAAAFWDPLEYFFDPNKRQYDRVQRYSTAILAELEPDSCYWGNEATIFYPLKYYYQDVLGERSDVSYHLVFGIVERAAEFQWHAATMLDQLEGNCPVYISSLRYPERQVLNRVYDALDETRGLPDVEALSEEALLETFPGHRLKAVDVDGTYGVRIFKIEPR